MKDETPRQHESSPSETKAKVDGATARISESIPRGGLREPESSGVKLSRDSESEKAQAHSVESAKTKGEVPQPHMAEARSDGKPEARFDQGKEQNSSAHREAGTKEAKLAKEGKRNEHPEPKTETKTGDKVEPKGDFKGETSQTHNSETRSEGKPESKVGQGKEQNSSGRREAGTKENGERTMKESILDSKSGGESKNNGLEGTKTSVGIDKENLRNEFSGPGQENSTERKDQSPNTSDRGRSEHPQSSAREGLRPEGSSSGKAGVKEVEPTREQQASFEQLQNGIGGHDWSKELNGKVCVFWSGQDRRTDKELQNPDIGKNDKYYAKNEESTPARDQALVFIAQRTDSSARAPTSDGERSKLEQNCLNQPRNSESRERVILDHTEMGQRISAAEKSGAITKDQADSLWDQASERFAEVSAANSKSIASIVFGRNANPDRTLVKREVPILKSGVTFSDEVGHPGDNKYDSGYGKITQ